jgi:hypothetical protein
VLFQCHRHRRLDEAGPQNPEKGSGTPLRLVDGPQHRERLTSSKASGLSLPCQTSAELRAEVVRRPRGWRVMSTEQIAGRPKVWKLVPLFKC